jgi:hypothetical protein
VADAGYGQAQLFQCIQVPDVGCFMFQDQLHALFVRPVGLFWKQDYREEDTIG